MIEFGKTLREAREAKGLSVSQLANTTHILPQIIENLEREDFSKIVAPIYGRGFVKLYCETVGIDAKPLIEEFMSIYSGDRPPVIRMKKSAPGTVAAPPATEETEPIETNLEAPSLATAMPESPTIPATEADYPSSHEPTPYDLPMEGLPPLAAKPRLSPQTEPSPFRAMPMSEPSDPPFPEEKPTHRRDYRMPGHTLPEVPRRFWRFGLLICAACAILTLVFFSCRALYRATMRTPADTPDAEQTVSDTTSQPTPSSVSDKSAPSQQKPTKTPRKPIDVPPLYID